MPVIDRPLVVNTSVPATPAVNTGAATNVTPPVVVDPNAITAPTGLNAATTAGPTPAAGGSIPVPGGQRLTIPGALTAPTGPSKLELLPGYPLCVSLPTVLKQLGNSPDGVKALNGVFDAFEKETGISIPAPLKAVIMAHPERIADALVVTPQQMRAGFDALNDAARSGKLKPSKPKERQLPARVDLKTLDYGSIQRGAGDAKEIAPGLLHGDMPSALSDDKAKRNIAGAEIFDRLAENALKPTKDDFKVAYLGKTYTTVAGFMEALKRDGHTITAHIDYRAADFGAMKLKNPNAPDGVLDVPAAIMIATGIKDANGKEAVLPAIHGELIFDIHPGPNTKGPGLDTNFKWYQGVPNTGFFPNDTSRRSTWVGHKTTATFDADAAIKAAHIAATFGDVVNGESAKTGLWMSGYGETGVCLDSVAVIEQLLTGTVNGYPLFMKDQLVLAEVKERLADGKHADDADLRLISKAIALIPSDDTPNATQKARAIASLPWSSTDPANGPPVQCVSDAMAVLGV